MSASEFRVSYQPVSSSQPTESTSQFKICRCEAGDPNFQITDKSETGDSSPTTCPNCQVLKSGFLLLSSKGIGWTVWKKRWFILTRTSLVFFRSDPNAPVPRGSEPIVTLGGIDLNNTASIIVKEERKVLTVVFPDGRDGRTFTLKAETAEDLNEWRNALDIALAQAPSVANPAGQDPVVSTDVTEPVEAAVEQFIKGNPDFVSNNRLDEVFNGEINSSHLLIEVNDTEEKSVVGRPAEFALVDADGSPAFLEKALKFIEDYGVKVEGILRQSADVEEVKRRLRDYEKGKNEFSPEEDAHVIGDCIKYILREMPSSPVPAPCCTALVRAYRDHTGTDKTRRLDAMNRVIYEVFPEPNRQLLQRILKMMQIVGSHKAVNRMSQSALAACMAPLLLRPLLLGECDIDNDFSMAGDGSFQLLQAAAAANHAQAIVIIMLEEYDQIFDDIEDGSYSSDAYTESDSGEIDDGSYGSGEDDIEHSSGGSECDSTIRNDKTDDKASVNDEVVQPSARAIQTKLGVSRDDSNQISSPKVDGTSQIEGNSYREKVTEKTSGLTCESKRNSWGRTSARKDLSTEENDCCSDDDDEAVVTKLENNKGHLESKIVEEVKGNTILHANLERRKEALHERRVALEKEVENLRDQLQKERNLRASLESGLMNMRRGQVSFPSTIDSKTKADLEEVAAAETDIMNLKQKVCDLRGQLNNQVQTGSTPLCESCNKQFQCTDKPVVNEQDAALSPEKSSSVKAPSTSLTSKWQIAHKQYANSPFTGRLQGYNAYSREDPGAATSSALAKLTSRLNFLKERRALLASEMQNMDMARPQGPAAPPKRDPR